MDREKLRKVVGVIEEMLKVNEDVLEELGVGVKTGRGRFGTVNAQLTLEIGDLKEDGSVESREAESYRLFCSYHVLPANLLNQTTLYKNRKWELVGLKPNSHKYPVLMKRDDGRIFKFPVSLVKTIFKVQ